MRRRWDLAVVAVVSAAPIVLFFAYPTYPNYDAYYDLVWGRELLHGVTPTFDAYKAPTQHPLYVGLGALLSLLGSGAERVLVAITIASLIALVWTVQRLGARIFGPWPGAAAAVFVGTSFAFLLYAVRAYVDVPFLALVGWAAVFAVQTADGRRQTADGDRRVLALLFLAGLLRPEAWVLAGLFWLWRRPQWPPRMRVLAAGAVVAAPVLWALSDWAVTGDPLHSLHATSDLADELGRTRGVGDLPGAFVSFLAGTVKVPVALAALAGAVLAWRRLDRRTLAVPLGLFAAGALTFLLTGLAGLSILPRYLTVPAVALCLFAGYALLGFTTLPPGSETRRRWARAALVAAVAGVAFAAIKAPSVGKLTGELRFVGALHSNLNTLVSSRAVQRGLRCGPVTFPSYRGVPDTRWLLDLPQKRVGARSARRRPTASRSSSSATRRCAATGSPRARARARTSPTRATSRSPARRASARTLAAQPAGRAARADLAGTGSPYWAVTECTRTDALVNVPG